MFRKYKRYEAVQNDRINTDTRLDCPIEIDDSPPCIPVRSVHKRSREDDITAKSFLYRKKLRQSPLKISHQDFVSWNRVPRDLIDKYQENDQDRFRKVDRVQICSTFERPSPFALPSEIRNMIFSLCNRKDMIYLTLCSRRMATFTDSWLFFQIPLYRELFRADSRRGWKRYLQHAFLSRSIYSRRRMRRKEMNQEVWQEAWIRPLLIAAERSSERQFINVIRWANILKFKFFSEEPAALQDRFRSLIADGHWNPAAPYLALFHMQTLQHLNAF